MDVSLIQARAATLRKTGNRSSLTSSPTTPPAVAPPLTYPKPSGGSRSVAPKPKAKPSRTTDDLNNSTASNSSSPSESVLRQRSQTLKHDRKVQPKPQPYEASVPSNYRKDFSSSSVRSSYCEDYIPEDAYDDIETVKKEMQKFKEVEQPPPLPPMNNNMRSKSLDTINNAPQVLLKRPAITPPVSENSSVQFGSKHLPNLSTSPMPSQKGAVPSTNSISLRVLIDTYCEEFPLQVRVTQGSRKSTAIIKGEVYEVHFIKRTEVVKIVTENGTSLFVPLNSATLFGAYYNPNNTEGPICGYTFNTAGEIMACNILPPLVYAQQTCETSSIDTSVQAGEILAIKDINKHRFRSRSLTCTVIGSNQTKKLFENCQGCFSTAPHDIKLYLPDILQHVSLPLKCIIDYEGLNAQDVLPHLPSGVVTLTEIQSIESLLVTRHSGGSTSTGYYNQSQDSLLELQLNADMLVEVIHSQMNAQMLQERSVKLYNTFSPALVDCVSLLTADTSYQLHKQATFFSTIRYDQSSYGVGIKLSKHLEKYISSKSTFCVEETNLEEDDDAYQFPDQAIAEYKAEQMKLNIRPCSPDSEYDIPQVQITPSTSQSSIAISEETYDIPRSAVPAAPVMTPKKMAPSLAAISEEKGDLQSQIDALKMENNSLRMTVDVLQKMIEGILSKTGKLT